MEQKQLDEILRLHDLWLEDDENGTRANLDGANLDGANLTRANLDGANLYGANLDGANLTRANLTRANLDGANLYGANLYGANLDGANLTRANLTRANLTRANLYGANLYGANLYGANGEKKYLKSIHCDTYDICYTSEVLQIGCQKHDIKEWWKFDDITIENMDRGALEWWKVWKPIIKKIIKVSPAKPTGYVEASK